MVNIFNKGLYEDLDLCEKKYIEHKQQLDTIKQFLTGLIKDPVRTHSTEKYEIYMQLTSKRCEKLKSVIEEYLLKYAPKGKEKNLLLSFNSDYDGKKVTFELDLHNFKYKITVLDSYPLNKNEIIKEWINKYTFDELSIITAIITIEGYSN